MRHDELRKVVHAAFKARLAKMLDGIGADGPMSELARAPLQTSRRLTEGTPEDFRAIALADDPKPFLSRFCASSGLPQSEAEERPERLLREIQMAWRDMLREFEKHHTALNHYDFNSTDVPALSIEPATCSTAKTMWATRSSRLLLPAARFQCTADCLNSDCSTNRQHRKREPFMRCRVGQTRNTPQLANISKRITMNNIIYIVGLIVVVLVILSFFGLR